MARQRSHSIEFKRQVAQEFIAGESLYALSKRHDISRQLIRVWVQKYEAGALDEDAQAADLLQEYEAKIAALERMVGRQALEIEFLKGALKNAPRPRSVNTSVIAGPAASPSQKDAGFSNRPSGSSTFRLSTSAVSMSLTGSRFSSDSAPGALPSWESKTRWNNLMGDLAVNATAGSSRHTNSPHPSSREGHHSTVGWILRFPPI